MSLLGLSILGLNNLIDKVDTRLFSKEQLYLVFEEVDLNKRINMYILYLLVVSLINFITPSIRVLGVDLAVILLILFITIFAFRSIIFMCSPKRLRKW